MIATARSKTRCRILVAESDRSFRATVAATLRTEGYDVTDLANGFELLQTLQSSMEVQVAAGTFDLVICDARLSGKTGLHVFSLLGDSQVLPPVVFTTLTRDQTVCDEAERLGAIAVLEKPVDLDELLALVHHLLDRGC